MKLRPYQEDFVNAVARGFHDGFRRQLGILPTGGGKTICFASIAERFEKKRNERTLVLAHREELVNQAVDKIQHATGLHATIEKANARANKDSPVVVGSIQTLQGNRLKGWDPDHFGLVVCDEAHHVLADQWQATLDHFNSRVLGVTATPDRGDKKNLSKYFENVAYECTILDLIRQGYLAQVMVQAVPLKIDISKARTVRGDFDANDVGDALLPYLDEIAGHLAKHCANRKILAFLPLISTSQKFVEACERAGISSMHVDGTSPDRSLILSHFGSGKFQLLSNAMLLTEGYDEPSIDCIVVLRPTRSRALYCQAVGRGTRLHEGKDDLLLLDFLWLHEKHDLAKASSLVAKNEEQEKSIAKAIRDNDGIDLEEAMRIAQMEREAALAKEIAENVRKKERFMPIEAVSAFLKDTQLSDYEPTFKWETMAATEGQRRTLERFKIKCPPTRGEASLLMDRLFTRSKNKLATVGQVKLLHRLKHPAPGECSAKEASEYIKTKIKS